MNLITEAQAKALRALEEAPLVRRERHLWAWEEPECPTVCSSETVRILCERGLASGYHEHDKRAVRITDAGREALRVLRGQGR